jgi:hypothetical protein
VVTCIIVGVLAASMHTLDVAEKYYWSDSSNGGYVERTWYESWGPWEIDYATFDWLGSYAVGSKHVWGVGVYNWDATSDISSITYTDLKDGKQVFLQDSLTYFNYDYTPSWFTFDFDRPYSGITAMEVTFDKVSYVKEWDPNALHWNGGWEYGRWVERPVHSYFDLNLNGQFDITTSYEGFSHYYPTVKDGASWTVDFNPSAAYVFDLWGQGSGLSSISAVMTDGSYYSIQPDWSVLGNCTPQQPVPEPATVLLLALGLVPLAWKKGRTSWVSIVRR